VTERFETFTSASIRTILAFRLVARCWFESEILTRIFVWVLQETPFVWHKHRLPTLEAISELPKYTRWFHPILSICGMDMGLVEKGEDKRWGAGRDELDEDNPIVPISFICYAGLAGLRSYAFTLSTRSASTVPGQAGKYQSQTKFPSRRALPDGAESNTDTHLWPKGSTPGTASRKKANGSSLALWRRFERVMYGLRVWRPRCSVTGHLIAQSHSTPGSSSFPRH
jgi:hypothetical protein